MSARPDWPFTPNVQRIGLAHEAACQIDALAHLLLDRVQDGHGECQIALLSVLVRVRELASVTIAALGDERDDEERMHHTVFGVLPLAVGGERQGVGHD